jgi:thiol:disulfide interchange protein
MSRRPHALLALAAGLVTAFGWLGAPASAEEPVASSTIHWHPVGEELVLADREGKPILYFFTADWCGPCHQLKRTLFADADKASRIAASFVPVVVQDTRVETGKNDPEVDAAIRRYRVSSLPTLVVTLPDGRELSQQRGYAGPDRAWNWLQQQARAAEAKIDEQ